MTRVLVFAASCTILAASCAPPSTIQVAVGAGLQPVIMFSGGDVLGLRVYQAAGDESLVCAPEGDGVSDNTLWSLFTTNNLLTSPITYGTVPNNFVAGVHAPRNRITARPLVAGVASCAAVSRSDGRGEDGSIVEVGFATFTP